MEPREAECICRNYVYKYAVYLVLASLNFGFFVTQTDLIKARDFHKFSDIIWDFQVVGWISAVLGTIIAGAVIRIPKRTKLIIANFLIVFCTVQLYWYEKKWIVMICRAIYGIAVGILTTAVPIYLREISPKEMTGSIFILHPVSFLTADEIIYLISYFIPKHKEQKFSWLELFSFCLPALTAFFQLLLTYIIFTKNSPKQLCQDMQEDECLSELAKIYTNPERRLAEYDQIKTIVQKQKYLPPTYFQLFKKKYRRAALIGLVMMLLRNLCGFLVIIIFSTDLFPKGIFDVPAGIIFGGLNIVGAVLPWIFSDSVGRKPILLTGSIFICGLHIASCVISIFKGNWEIHSNNEVSLFISIISIISIGFYGLSIGSLSFVFVTEILPERGFALAMAVYWITLCLLVIPFADFVKIYNTDLSKLDKIYTIYMIGFSIAAILIVIFIWAIVPETKTKSQLEINKILGIDRKYSSESDNQSISDSLSNI